MFASIYQAGVGGSHVRSYHLPQPNTMPIPRRHRTMGLHPIPNIPLLRMPLAAMNSLRNGRTR